jgi:hypothetical protein
MTPTGEIDAALRNTVEQAFPEAVVDVVDADGEAPFEYRSENAEAAWKRMHEAAAGREIPVLLEMLDGTWLTGEERWKAVTFLGYSLATPDSAPEREKILEALALEAIVKQRGSASADAVRIQGAALDAVARAPLDADVKWQFMLVAIQSSRSYFREIVRRLSGFRPSDPTAVADAYPILLDALVRGDIVPDVDSVARLVRELDVRRMAPELRRLLLAANSHLSARVATILADWDDKAAAFEIRRAINQYSTANDPSVDDLFDALYRLEGPASTAYLAEVFRSAPPALQEYMLLHSLRTIPSRAIVAAVRDVVATTKDVELKQVAEAWLEAAPEVPVEDETAATGIPSADSPAAAEPDTWQPVYEKAADPPKPAPVATPTVAAGPAPAPKPDPAPAPRPVTAAAAPAASAAPTPPAPKPVPTPAPAPPPAEPAGAWQPTVDDPQSRVSDEARSQRLGSEAEYLARLREDAAREAEERLLQQQQAGEGSGALEVLVKLPLILFVLFVIGAVVAVYYSGELTGGTSPAP